MMRRACCMALLAGALLTVTDAPAAASPAAQAEKGEYVYFERIGHHGGLYFNADGSYVILQTDPKGKTVAFDGRWETRDKGGFCLLSGATAQRRCFPALPEAGDPPADVSNDAGEVYRIVVMRRR